MVALKLGFVFAWIAVLTSPNCDLSNANTWFVALANINPLASFDLRDRNLSIASHHTVGIRFAVACYSLFLRLFLLWLLVQRLMKSINEWTLCAAQGDHNMKHNIREFIPNDDCMAPAFHDLHKTNSRIGIGVHLQLGLGHCCDWIIATLDSWYQQHLHKPPCYAAIIA